MKKKLKTKNEKENEKTEILWIESGRAGYCLTERDYNKRKKAGK